MSKSESSTNNYKELILGVGSSRVKKLVVNGRNDWTNLVTLDINADHHPDIVWDLEALPLPFADNEFDEIHAYEVLEHTGQQGDYKFFFSQFSEFWRILKPGGYLIGSCPSRNSPWAWGDPSHKRVIQAENLVFLDQSEYVKQVGITPMSDFRYIYHADFECIYRADDDTSFTFAVRAVKPSRLSVAQNQHLEGLCDPRIFNICCIGRNFFGNTVEAIRYGLAALGKKTYVNDNAFVTDGVNIIIGAHLLKEWDSLPANTVIFNQEQLASGSALISDNYLNALSRFKVLDYSPRNIEWLKVNNINKDVKLVRLGFSPTLEKIKTPDIQDIDVLFYGAINERRQRIVEELKIRGLNAITLFGVFGDELDAYVGRAKVVLNIHFYGTHLFEMGRVAYLLNNRKAVVSEISAVTEIEPDIREAIVGVPYEEIVDSCVRLVHDPNYRRSVEERGYNLFSKRSQAKFLLDAISEL